MKKIIVTFFVIILITTTQAFNAKFQNGPKLTFDVSVVDFGEVNLKTDLGFRVLKYKNSGTQPLTIINVKSSCSCLTAEASKEPLMPGKSGTIKVKYDIKRQGPISKTITLVTDEVESIDANKNPVYKTYTINVKGNVAAKN